MTLLMLLLLSQQAHQHLGPMCGERCTLPIWTVGVTAWRLLYGQLFVGGFSRHVHFADPAG